MIDKKVVFFDLDGTLLTSELQVDESSITAIKLIQERGKVPDIATGTDNM